MNNLPLELEDISDEPVSPAAGITRGVCRLLTDMGYRTLLEFKLTSRRRADVAGLDRNGKFVIVEVKSSLADFRADSKWPEYLPFCDAFFFAVDTSFPLDHLPPDHGLIVADDYGASVRRTGDLKSMNGNRRRNQTLRFARIGAARLQSFLDPVR